MKAMELKEEIRSRLNIEDVIGEYIQLRRAGRNFKGLSPFSQEKTPSFMISPDKGIWHDFSSGKGGDVFSFIMEVEGLDFKATLELLARKAGVDMAKYQSVGSGMGQKKERLYAACDMAAKYYQLSLLKSQTALGYVVQKRGLNKQVVQDFRIGYAPNTGDALSKALVRHGFTEQELRDAGLSVNRRGFLGDMFRGRMMVALADAQGRVVGFTARIIADDPDAPKYINTPQTLLYDKGRNVFALHLAKDAIRQANFVVIVEGQLDVVSSHQAGVKNVVATAGTAITENHLRSLSRFTQDVRLAFDADKAGVNATERAIALATNLGINLSIVRIPSDVKDPDELLKKDVKLWQKAIEHPVDAVEWLLDEYAHRYDVTSAEGKRRATDQALSVVRGIADPVISEHYTRLIAERIGSSLAAVNAKLQQSSAIPTRKKAVQHQSGPDPYQYQDHLLALAWAYPQIRDSLRKLQPQDFGGELRPVIAEYLQAHSSEPAQVQDLQSDDIHVKIKELELIVEAKYPTLTDELYFDAADIAKRIQKEQKQHLRSELAKAFASATESSERAQLSRAIKKLDKEVEALKH